MTRLQASLPAALLVLMLAGCLSEERPVPRADPVAFQPETWTVTGWHQGEPHWFVAHAGGKWQVERHHTVVSAAQQVEPGKTQTVVSRMDTQDTYRLGGRTAYQNQSWWYRPQYSVWRRAGNGTEQGTGITVSWEDVYEPGCGLPWPKPAPNVTFEQTCRGVENFTAGNGTRTQRSFSNHFAYRVLGRETIESRGAPTKAWHLEVQSTVDGIFSVEDQWVGTPCDRTVVLRAQGSELDESLVAYDCPPRIASFP